jgi:hypothetical protein
MLKRERRQGSIVRRRVNEGIIHGQREFFPPRNHKGGVKHVHVC